VWYGSGEQLKSTLPLGVACCCPTPVDMVAKHPAWFCAFSDRVLTWCMRIWGSNEYTAPLGPVWAAKKWKTIRGWRLQANVNTLQHTLGMMLENDVCADLMGMRLPRFVLPDVTYAGEHAAELALPASRRLALPRQQSTTHHSCYIAASQTCSWSC
jgi:hypothetical protein